MKFVYLILARKGSVRLKNKNLKKINNKTLVERTIEFSKKISNLNNIILSTDSNKIRNLGLKNKLNIPYLRPKKISQNKISSYLSAMHAINLYEKKNGEIDAIVLLQPTTPYRSIKTFRKILRLFLRDARKPLVSVKKINLTSDKFFIKKKDLIIKYQNKSFAKEIYIPNGAYFLITKRLLKKNKDFLSKKMNFFEIKNIKENIDIDSNNDLNLARKLC